MLRDLMPAVAKPEDPVWTTAIMTYELGGVVRALIYADHKRGQGDAEGVRALLATARIGLADLIVQGRVLAEQMEWKMVDLENDGLERFAERMKELKEGTI